MDSPSLRRLSLAGIDEATLRQLVDHGESLYVDRKLELPEPPKFGAAAGAFANTLGGILLLGVRNDGAVVGWKKPERLDLQSHLGQVLRAEVDPLPPFIADMRELDGKPIGVVRVFESEDRPHVTRGTGAIYMRTSAGKEPIPVDDPALVIELARRGEEAARRARDRLALTPGVNQVLGPPPREGQPELLAPRGLKYIARAAPLTVTPALTDWPLTRPAAEVCGEVIDQLVPPAHLDGLGLQRDPQIQPFGRGYAKRIFQRQSAGREVGAEAAAVVDSNGVVGVSMERTESGGSPSFLVNAILEAELLPIANALATMLESGECVGRVATDLWIRTADPRIQDGDVLRRSGDLHVARDLTAPLEQGDVISLAESWHREIQRSMGIVKFEDDADA
ncbi:MAG: hypothetical protein BroJett024_43070 [Alphaproteobacteria bacterium]|nr:MAG: hypothetical protein BroJett024_43070 [Alphaproteobacteria bacterium]